MRVVEAQLPIDGEAALEQKAVVAAAEQDQVREVGVAVVGPVPLTTSSMHDVAEAVCKRLQRELENGRHRDGEWPFRVIVQKVTDFTGKNANAVHQVRSRITKAAGELRGDSDPVSLRPR